MSNDPRIVLIGGGRMGEAIAAGLLAAGAVEASRIAVADPNEPRRAIFESHGIATASEGDDIVRDADIVLFAIKPQVATAAIAHLADRIPETALVVSIVAGLTCSRMEAILRPGTPVARVMPNTPALVAEGMSVVSGGRHATAAQVAEVVSLFGALGKAITVDERLQDAAGAISGCGPAYVAVFIDALARAGVRQGLTHEVAQTLAAQTLRGTVELLERTGKHPEELVDAVCSPGGTTIAAVEALEAGGLRATVAAAVTAAVGRSRELGE